jgi:hypothetical protein
MSDEEEVSILAHKKSKKPQFIDSDDDDSEEEVVQARQGKFAMSDSSSGT